MPLITKQSDLEEICNLIKKHKIAAIDSEFIREKTYFPILCLIQINVAGKFYLIDTLSKLNLGPFYSILADEKIIKILHSSRQDLEVFLQSAINNNVENFTPKSIFDTQLMAALCGIGFNISYQNLVRDLIGEEVNKECQRSDWRQRPLSLDQTTYAKIDVKYLPEIYQILLEKLENKRSWAKDEMELNVKKATDEDDLLKKFSLGNKDEIYCQNVVLLANWRDEKSRKKDVPRGYVMRDDMIEMIALGGVAALDDLNFKSRRRDEVALVLENRDSVKDLEFSSKMIVFRMNKSQKEILQKSKDILQIQANKYQVNFQLIINRVNLESVVLGNKSVKESLSGWRYEVFGEELEKLIS
ncbi:MAG: ribonuclease D [Lentimonas sp.]|jgi:ribonuclease D